MRKIYPIEEDEQITVIDWVRSHQHYYKELKYLTASMNGIRLSIYLAVKAKALGLIKGAPDLELPSARGGYFGLYIEMKRQPGARSEISAEQAEYLQYLNNAGYCAVVSYGADQAIKTLSDYLQKPLTKQPRGNMALDFDMAPGKIAKTVCAVANKEYEF